MNKKEYTPMKLNLGSVSQPSTNVHTPMKLNLPIKTPAVAHTNTQSTYKPVSLSIVRNTFPELHEPPKPSVTVKPLSGLTPTTVFKQIEVSDDDIRAVFTNPKLSDSSSIRAIVAELNANDYDKAIANIGVDEQAALAEIPQEIHCVVPKGGALDQTMGILADIKEVIEKMNPKKGFLSFLFKADANNVKSNVTLLVKSLKVYIPELEAIKAKVYTLRTDAQTYKLQLEYHSAAVKILKNKIDKKHEFALDSRLSTIYISNTIAIQTLQLIELKVKNIDNIIGIIRDTILVSIPSWFNQLEILEQMEASNVDNEVMQNVLTSQNQILEKLNTINNKGVSA